MKKLFGPLVLGVFLSLGIVLSPGYLFANENLYSESEIANLDESLQNLSNQELQDLSEDLISEKEAIEQRIEEGEIDPADENNSFIVRLKNIYTELSLIQKILSGVGVFLVFDQLFGGEDEPRIPDVSVANASVTEGAGSVSVTVSLSNSYGQEISVSYATADGTAVSGLDYETQSGNLVFAPNETSKSFSVPIIDNEVYEEAETFSVNIGLVGESLGTIANGSATVTINDDEAVPQISITDLALTEGQSGDLIVSVSNAAEQEITLDYATVDGSATNQDYNQISGSLTFASGELEKTISVTTLDDALDENEESFTLELSNLNIGTFSDSSASITIADNDEAPEITLTGANTVDENEDLAVTLALSTASGKTITIDLSTLAGTAQADEDYLSVDQTVTLLPGESSKTIILSIVDDAIDEDNETFQVVAANSVNANLASSPSAPNGVLDVEILDNDEPPTFALTVADVEEGETASLNLTLSGPSAKPISVLVATADGTASSADYEAVSATVDFAPGETSKTLSVVTTEDTTDEFDETVLVNISEAVNVLVPEIAYSFSILDDDEAPNLSFNDQSVTEGASFDVEFVLSEASAKDISFSVTTAVGTAGANDFTAVSETLTISAGATTATQSFSVLQDALDEEDETFTINVGNLTNVSAANSSATVTILDDDEAPSVTISGSNNLTEGQDLTVTVALST
ncbi:MAG: hypothetical protein EBT20_14575, partial [Alphaproteobacteria bacterium]|nr:hypothetical protein [Alphaproteobacteria bacterium]